MLLKPGKLNNVSSPQTKEVDREVNSQSPKYSVGYFKVLR